MVGLALAILLLAPVPAMGLMFLGSWNIFQSPGGVPGSFTSNSDNPNNYFLTIGMGVVSPPSSITKYSVTATRDFQITDPNELVRISHSFASLLNDGSINVTLSIQQFGVANDPFNFPPYSVFAPAGPPPGTLFSLDDFFKTGNLTKGLYRLSLTITYQRTPTGSWNNSSPHTFNFRGL
jgi:hypothetical protein